MKRLDYILATTAVTLFITAVTLAMPTKTHTQPASAATNCPAATAQGEYHEQGRDDNGNAICGFTYSNACPYAEGYSATDPMCAKFADNQKPVQPVTKPNPAQPSEATQCGAK